MNLPREDIKDWSHDTSCSLAGLVKRGLVASGTFHCVTYVKKSIFGLIFVPVLHEIKLILFHCRERIEHVALCEKVVQHVAGTK